VRMRISDEQKRYTRKSIAIAISEFAVTTDFELCSDLSEIESRGEGCCIIYNSLHLTLRIHNMA
jgi:hypothetical protein